MTVIGWAITAGAAGVLAGLTAVILYFRWACREQERTLATETEKYLCDRAEVI